jgi:hypothetical protein
MSPFKECKCDNVIYMLCILSCTCQAIDKSLSPNVQMFVLEQKTKASGS